MEDLVVIKARTKSGFIQEFQVVEILEIDGKVYQSTVENMYLRDAVMHLSGRMEILEKTVFSQQGLPSDKIETI